eukprot:565807-Lingulodinium_polyedra.AAC.1
MLQLASEARTCLGPPAARLNRAEAALRLRVHDALYVDHGKDYRCLATFALASTAELVAQVPRVSAQ